MTSDTLPKLYTLTGHDEASLSDTLTSQIEKENIDIEELNLVTSESVPDDADCLMINGPQKDITADEKDRKWRPCADIHGLYRNGYAESGRTFE